MYRISFLVLSLAVMFSSCNKDDDQLLDDQALEPNFYGLKVGNSWKYKFLRLNGATGELVDSQATEEVEITAEEVIDGETVYTMTINTSDPLGACGICNSETTATRKVKDSLGFLVEVGGPIIFSSENDQDYVIAEEEWGTVYRVLLPNEVLITVPAGQFVAKDNQRYAILQDGQRAEGQDNLFYAEGIGEIRQTISGVNTPRIFYEKQLVSYSGD